MKCVQATSVMQQSQAAHSDAVSRALTDEAGIQVLPSASHPPGRPPPADIVPLRQGWQEGAATRSPQGTAWHLNALPPCGSDCEGAGGRVGTRSLLLSLQRGGSVHPRDVQAAPAWARCRALPTLAPAQMPFPRQRPLHRPLPSPLPCLGLALAPNHRRR